MLKKERMDILMALYNKVIDNSSMHIGYNMNVEEMACGAFDLEYLEAAGYVRIGEGSPEKGWDVYLTVKGIDAVEEYLHLLDPSEELEKYKNLIRTL
nr:hypothetical protein [Heyndrickxia oleronia]